MTLGTSITAPRWQFEDVAIPENGEPVAKLLVLNRGPFRHVEQRDASFIFQNSDCWLHYVFSSKARSVCLPADPSATSAKTPDSAPRTTPTLALGHFVQYFLI